MRNVFVLVCDSHIKLKNFKIFYAIILLRNVESNVVEDYTMCCYPFFMVIMHFF